MSTSISADPPVIGPSLDRRWRAGATTRSRYEANPQAAYPPPISGRRRPRNRKDWPNSNRSRLRSADAATVAPQGGTRRRAALLSVNGYPCYDLCYGSLLNRLEQRDGYSTAALITSQDIAGPGDGSKRPAALELRYELTAQNTSQAAVQDLQDPHSSGSAGLTSDNLIPPTSRGQALRGSMRRPVPPAIGRCSRTNRNNSSSVSK